MAQKPRLNPFITKHIAERRLKGIQIKDIMEELEIHPSRYSKWKKQAIELVEAHKQGNIKNLTKHQINLINFLTAVTEAEQAYHENFLKEFNSSVESYKGIVTSDIPSLANEKELKSYEGA